MSFSGLGTKRAHTGIRDTEQCLGGGGERGGARGQRFLKLKGYFGNLTLLRPILWFLPFTFEIIWSLVFLNYKPFQVVFKTIHIFKASVTNQLIPVFGPKPSVFPLPKTSLNIIFLIQYLFKTWINKLLTISLSLVIIFDIKKTIQTKRCGKSKIKHCKPYT